MKKLKALYERVYGKEPTVSQDFDALKKLIITYKNSRSKTLKEMDQNKDWFFEHGVIGMTLYIDLFATNFDGLIDKMGYFDELGITFVHLMPLLKPRPGENDGGYAVMDYQDVDPKLGNLAEFKNLLETFRSHHINVCIDYVINHVAKEHQWAQKALLGDLDMQAMFIMYDTKDIPNQFNKTVPEVLPDKSPGNFTYYKEIKKYVFTSFSDFQWDLNFQNPKVFNGMVDNMLYLANLGIQMLRLDAVPFMWKELNTNCRNLPTVHLLLEMLHLIKDDVCPSLALLGEAIVEPHEIIKYYGTKENKECEVMYNANLMVNIFNSFSTRDTRLLQIDINEYQIPPSGTWMNYVRCHDDIGWGFNEQAITQMGLDPFYHKQFLIDFYNGTFDGSFAMGEDYQFNKLTLDARTNGALASLLGLEKAEKDFNKFEVRTSLDRINLSNALMMFYQGFPLIYSGDEIATINDQTYLNDNDKSNEGRWIHRAKFDWQRAKKRHVPYTNEFIVFQTLKHLIKIRKNAPFLAGNIKQQSIQTSSHQVLCIKRLDSLNQSHFGIFNFSENPLSISLETLKYESKDTLYVDAIFGRTIDLNHKKLSLSPYEFLWLTPKNK